MRPKVVILTMVVAFVLLGAIAAIKGIMGRHVQDNGEQTNAVAQAQGGGEAGTNGAGAGAVAVIPPQVSPELRAELVSKEQEEIQELFGEANGSNNGVIITALVEKVKSREAEVRKAALSALATLNDTNAVPELQKLADKTEDPREKVAIMDTIDYLNLPDAFANVKVTTTNNSDTPVVIPPNLHMNPVFLHTNSAAVKH
jgi:hypothetical protein